MADNNDTAIKQIEEIVKHSRFVLESFQKQAVQDQKMQETELLERLEKRKQAEKQDQKMQETEFAEKQDQKMQELPKSPIPITSPGTKYKVSTSLNSSQSESKPCSNTYEFTGET